MVQVTDTGIGIPKDALPKLGKEFYRAPNARRQEPTGTGLGLAITTDLVEALGGHMAIHSVVDKGSTFTLRFPTS